MNRKTGGVVVATSVLTAVCVAAVLLLLNRFAPETLGRAAPASPDEPWVRAIVERVDELEQRNVELQQAVTTAERKIVTMEEVFTAAGVQLETTLDQLAALERTVVTTDTAVSSIDRDLEETRERLQQLQAEEEEKETQELTLDDFARIELDPINGLVGPHIIFEGVNVHVRSGSGATDDFGGELFGLGNVIVGYNEPDAPFGRFGSHNLVVGGGHAYTSYAGFLAGYGNYTGAPNASVPGGTGNEAVGLASTVTGGDSNRAAGENATISGGSENRAEGLFSKVSGGRGNTAEGPYAIATGGEGNRAIGELSGALGGARNWTNTRLSVIVAGIERAVDGAEPGSIRFGQSGPYPP